MTQSDAPNEQLSNQEIGDLWEEYEAVMIRRWPPEEYGEDEDLSVLYSITEQFKTELLLLRDQLSKEAKMRKELVDGIGSLLEMLQPFENMEAMGPLESVRMREIESLIAKASELDKNQ